MNSTGQHGEKASYRIILLLVVGLTAFSSAMKELNQLQQFGLEASRLAAEWSGKLVPAEVPPRVPVITVENTPLTCENKELQQSAPSVELRQLRRLEIDPVEFEVRILSDHDAEAGAPVAPELPLYTFKAKSRKHNLVRNPREREIILKSVNRSINLRIAG
jgi:hypothetical protein